MVCLANSRKTGGRCVAGIDLRSGKWIRPVNDNGESLSLKDISYEDGSVSQLLEVVEVPLIRHQPLYYQPENWIIDKTVYWSKLGELTPQRLEDYCDAPPLIFYDARDRLPKESVLSNRVSRSLCLIRVESVCFVKKWGMSRSFPQIRAEFEYGGAWYSLVVTDDAWEQKFRGRGIELGRYPYNEPFLLTISLGEEFQGQHYKLVAGVIRISG